MNKIKNFLYYLEKYFMIFLVLGLFVDYAFFSKAKMNDTVNLDIQERNYDTEEANAEIAFINEIEKYFGENELHNVIKSHIIETRIKTNQVYLIHPIPYRKLSEIEIALFVDRVIRYSFKYRREAKARGLERKLPVNQFAFKMIHEQYSYSQDEKESRVVGHCDLKNNIIYLHPRFNEATFFHELGHCDLVYSHKNDKKVLASGKSDYIMNWNFEDNKMAYYETRRIVLDHFFDTDNHTSLHSAVGYQMHLSMASQIDEYKETMSNREN